MIYDLCEGDLYKLETIENTDYITCIEWFYIKRVNDLNQMMAQLVSLKKIKETRK